MSNQTTTQEPTERGTKQSQHLHTTFQTLKELPTPFYQAQCVPHKHELLICGGVYKRACYSYHTLKNEYKFICEYPNHVKLQGHCTVKLVNNNKHSNQITLLSFGGKCKHTLMMKYVSVWSNISDKLNKSNELNNYNQWIPFTDNHNRPIIIGRIEDNYYGVRAVIGGSNNHLLFITYLKNNISVFDLNIFQFIKHDTLPTSNFINYHCFVLRSENEQEQEQEQEMIKTNKQNYQMLLFKYDTGLSIEYDEDKSIFKFHPLSVCYDIAAANQYAYACINDIILFFGGRLGIFTYKSVHKYLIRENKWITFENTLHSPLCDCVAVLSEEDHIHIIGGIDDKHITVSTHMKTKVREWDPSHLSKNEIKCIIEYWIQISEIKFGWIDDLDKIIMKYSRNK
ncbi:hypothetical protein RFI_22073 [Reticulomyxa filosa]|uniref:Kelch motif family protein n=1 Tax=Reticulomyxa filosa TaxID=46433 RepID=X6MNQ3_RETFI|nr:hypothetical protein RFI_22073 [Reticulomyxa filosa]|eukprot:ETO15291.1 hypothetical protein RFI_22073 [Reticulomyxa filosa]